MKTHFGLVLALVFSGAALAAGAERPVHLMPGFIGKCAVVIPSPTSADGELVLSDCLDRNEAKWRLVRNDDGRYAIVNAAGGRCLSVENESREDGARVTIDTCRNPWSTRWELLDRGGHEFWLRNVNSGKCLHVPASETENGTPLVQWTCLDLANMSWHFAPAWPEKEKR